MREKGRSRSQRRLRKSTKDANQAGKSVRFLVNGADRVDSGREEGENGNEKVGKTGKSQIGKLIKSKMDKPTPRGNGVITQNQREPRSKWN